ncbi:MAG TPA: hypothetical protein DCM05_17465, partial [Elusimicrobia bacterium]|nr:hypothetical protein [Elusimicrobiota bacterium]
EIQALLDDLNGRFTTYPNTGSRRDAQFNTSEAKDNALWAENNLKAIRGTGAEPLKALIEAGGQAAKTLVSMCDSYLAMDHLAGEAKQ